MSLAADIEYRYVSFSTIFLNCIVQLVCELIACLIAIPSDKDFNGVDCPV